MLIVAALLLADCALGTYLDRRMRPQVMRVYNTTTESAPPQADVYLVRDAATELVPVASGNLRSCGIWQGQGMTVTRAVPCDGPNTFAFRDNDPDEWRVYATYTDTVNSGFFRNQRHYWQYIWRGHATWLLAPSWRQK